MSKNKEPRLPPEVNEEYEKFCYELVKREKNGEKIYYEKESIDFWNKKLKEVLKNRKAD